MPTVQSKLLRAGGSAGAAILGAALFARVTGYDRVILEGFGFTRSHNRKENDCFDDLPGLREVAVGGRRRRSPAMNQEFFRQVYQLLSTVFTSPLCNQSILLLLHTLTLICRTFLSIYIANLDGTIVKTIVEREPIQFLKMLFKWLAVALPATFINSAIRFLEKSLALSIRTKMVQHAYREYFAHQTYYRVSNLDGRLANADQCLTEDLKSFADSVAHVYSNVSKPLLDITLMSYTLYRLASSAETSISKSSAIGFSVFFLTGGILRLAAPSFGKLVAEEARRNGYLRYVNSRLIANAEEVAFYGGNMIEQTLFQRAYLALATQMQTIFNKRLWYVMLEQFLMKYVWSASGLCMVAIPIMSASKRPNVATLSHVPLSQEPIRPLGSESTIAVYQHQDDGEVSVSDRTQAYSMAKSLLLSAGDALERLLASYKDITELAGYTSRVAEMFHVFEEVKRGSYQRTAVSTGKDSHKWLAGSTRTSHQRPKGVFPSAGENCGMVEEGEDCILLENVPIVTPNNDVVVEQLSMELKPDMHLLISGPNGCGKSSLLRILCGLWPVQRGRLVKPPNQHMFYIPQKPYMTLGTLRSQVIYPDTMDDMRRKGLTDAALISIMKMVHLDQIISREGGWDAVNDWQDVLSGGEKQRMGMARLFYHKPRFALLDECTSAVSMDVEGAIYQALKDRGTTLITITHRPSLWRFHSHLLQFDGEGGWRFEQLDSVARMSLREEKERLEAQLSGVPSMQLRLQELCGLLGEDSVLAHQQSEQLEASGSQKE